MYYLLNKHFRWHQYRRLIAHRFVFRLRLTDDLKHILGNETSRIGLLLLFSMFQHQVLNKRLLYVLLEGLLVEL